MVRRRAPHARRPGSTLDGCGPGGYCPLGLSTFPRKLSALRRLRLFRTGTFSCGSDCRQFNTNCLGVAHEEGDLHSFAAVLGNDVAIKAYREGKLPFPDGAIILALHYKHVPSEEKKYAATGGWGFGHFNTDGKPGGEALLKTCAPCHAQACRDSVFTRYAP